MDDMRAAVIFLLNEYIDFLGSKYTGYVAHLDEVPPREALLREALRKERDRLEKKLDEAKSFLDALKVTKPDTDAEL